MFGLPLFFFTRVSCVRPLLLSSLTLLRPQLCQTFSVLEVGSSFTFLVRRIVEDEGLERVWVHHVLWLDLFTPVSGFGFKYFVWVRGRRVELTWRRR